MYTNRRYNFIVNVIYYGIIVLIVYLVIKFLFAYLLPFIIGAIVTAMVQKPAAYISAKTKIKKGYCALGLVIAEYLIIIGIISLLLFELGNYIYTLATGESKLLGEITSFVDKLLLDFENMPDFISESLKNVLNGFTGILTDFAKQTLKGVPMFFTSLLVTVVASCYIAKDYDRFKASVLSVTSERYRTAAKEIKILFNDNIKNLVIGYLKIMLITFVQLLVGFVILKVDNAVLYAGLISLFDLLPILGAGMVLVPWAIYTFFVSNYYLGFGLLILYIIIVITRNAIEPKIIGKQMGLHPLIALITVFIGLKFIGFLGMFIAPFLTMLIYKIYENGIAELIFTKENKAPWW